MEKKADAKNERIGNLKRKLNKLPKNGRTNEQKQEAKRLSKFIETTQAKLRLVNLQYKLAKLTKRWPY